MKKQLVLAALGAALFCVTASGAAFAQMPEEIQPGVRMEMEGRIFDATTLLALEMTVLRAPTGEDSVKGIVQQVDHEKKTMRVAGVFIDCSGDCFVAGDDGRPIAYERIETGQRAKAKGEFKNGVFIGDYIKVKEMKPGASAEVDMEGRISKVDRPANMFVVNGVNVQVTGRTLVELE